MVEVAVEKGVEEAGAGVSEGAKGISVVLSVRVAKDNQAVPKSGSRWRRRLEGLRERGERSIGARGGVVTCRAAVVGGIVLCPDVVATSAPRFLLPAAERPLAVAGRVVIILRNHGDGGTTSSNTLEW